MLRSISLLLQPLVKAILVLSYTKRGSFVACSSWVSDGLETNEGLGEGEELPSRATEYKDGELFSVSKL